MFWLCLVLCCQALTLVSGINLELSSVVFRHGQRSPIQSFPLDAYTEFDWPQGYGQLSELGMQQHYHLGQLFRQRYVGDDNCSGLVCGNYTRIQVTIRSTDVDRTLMSAESQLASLFAPADDAVFPDLSWVPVPIHTVPTQQDTLLRSWDECAQYKILHEQSMQYPEYLKKNEENKDFFAQVANQTGLVPLNLSNIWMVYDTVKIENGTEGYSSPPWVTEEVLHTLKTLNDYTMTQMFNSTAINRLTAGEYLGKVLSDMKNRTDPNMNMTQRLFLYSAHDTTVAAIMSALNIFDNKQPGYATAFSVELYSDDDGNYYVKFYERKGPGSDSFDLIQFPPCKNSSLCTLEEFEKFVAPLIPEDIKKECQPPVPVPSSTVTPLPTSTPSPPSNVLEQQNRTLKTSVIALGCCFCVSLLVVIVLVVMMISSCKKKSRSSRRRYDVLVEE